MLFLLPCILLFFLHHAVSENTRDKHYTISEGKRMTGQVIDTIATDSPIECGVLCLKEACKAYNIITTDEDTSCEIIGDELQTSLTDDAQTDCYCKSK